MKLTDKKSGETLDVALSYFRGGFNPDLGPCCLADLASGELSGRYDVETDSHIVDDLDSFVDWWENEVNCANTNPDYQGDGLVGVPVECRERGDEWCLNVSKVF